MNIKFEKFSNISYNISRNMKKCKGSNYARKV